MNLTQAGIMQHAARIDGAAHRLEELQLCGGMLRHIEMHHTPPLMRKDNEDKQHFQL
jgi:hypothetical protein